MPICSFSVLEVSKGIGALPVCTRKIRVRVELHCAVKQITQLHFKEEIPAKRVFAWSPSKKNVKPTY